MANAQAGTVLRHIHKLVAVHEAGQLKDHQLLERFAAGRDEQAFATLLQRHGPMVLGVCRRVLHHLHDAEDAFQATFLILARKAGSIRRSESVGGWLHQVAYHLAVKARASAARRASGLNPEACNKQGDLMASADPMAAATWQEVRTLLDAELQQLPDNYRAALVLCYLEGKTHEESAHQLGWSKGTLRRRLGQGRELLRRRLLRRGLAPAAALTATLTGDALGATAVTAVPHVSAMLAGSTLEAALQFATGQAAAGIASAPVAALVEGGLNTMFLTKMKTAMAVLLVVGLVAGVGVLTHRTLAADQSTVAGESATAAAVEEPPPVKKDASAPTPADKKAAADTVQVTGRVLGPDGKAVKGAKLIFVYSSGNRVPEKVWATSAADGKFRFPVPKGTLDEGYSEKIWEYTYVVAAAEGYGFAATLVGKPEATKELTLRLVKDDVPIRGRILDLQGQPVAGVNVRIDNSVSVPKKGDLTPWLDALKAKKAGPGNLEWTHLTHLWSPALVSLFPAVTTGADGSFQIKGIGPERVASLRIEGPTIVTKQVKVITRRDGQPSGYFPATFDHVAAPTKPVVGVVRDKDTGKPLAGVSVHSHLIAGTFPPIDNNLIRTTTDKEGRYRLIGLPKAEGNVIMVDTHGVLPHKHDLPYLSATARVANTPGLDPVTVDFGLKRGIWVTGRVTDKATGKPLWAGVEYFCFLDNPHAKEITGRGSIMWCSSGTDGIFRTVALPGRGLIAVRAYRDAYVRAVGEDKIKGPRDGPWFRTVPYYLIPVNYHTLVEIARKVGDESITCDVTLDPGHSVKGTVLGPDGKPLAGTRASGLSALGDCKDALPGADFTVRSLTDKPRLLQVVHEGKRLAGFLVIKGTDRGPLTVKLEASGTLSGRLIRPDGEPMTGVEIHSGVGADGDGLKFGSFPNRIQPGKDGRFRIEGLAPGLKYNLYVIKPPGYGLEISGKQTNELTIKPGETKDLGDIEVKPME